MDKISSLNLPFHSLLGGQTVLCLGHLYIYIILGRTILIKANRKTNEQLTKWKANSISQTGRTVLIKANLEVKPNFLIQTFMLFSQVHHELDRTNRCFLWNKEPNHFPLIGWDKVCRPKKYGGLGINKAENTNKALHIKLIWKIMTELDNLWVKTVNEKYLKSIHVLKYKKKANTSWQ